MGGQAEVAEIIQVEAREMRVKQDRKLQGLLRTAAGSLVAYLSLCTIAVAASGALAPAIATVAVVFAAVLGLMVLYLGGVAGLVWKEGPSADRLLEFNRTERPDGTQLRLALSRVAAHDYQRNERTLRAVRLGVICIAVLALLGLAVLLGILNELW